jgi:hypothetical protein
LWSRAATIENDIARSENRQMRGARRAAIQVNKRAESLDAAVIVELQALRA